MDQKFSQEKTRVSLLGPGASSRLTLNNELPVFEVSQA